MQANVFRFIVRRPPQRLSETELADMSVETHPAGQEKTRLLTDLLDKRTQGDRAGMQSLSRVFLDRGAPATIGSFDELATPIKALDQWLSKKQPDLTAELFVTFVQDLVNIPISAFVKSQAYLGDRRRVGDTLLAQMIAGRQRQRVPAFLARTMRIFGILEQFVREEKRILTPGNIEKALKAMILLPAALYPLPRPEDREAVAREKAFGKRLEAYKVLEVRAKEVASKISRHEAAIDEIMAGYEFDRGRELERANKNTPPTPLDNSADDRPQPVAILPRPTPHEVSSVLSAEATELLSDPTIGLLSAMRINVLRIHVVETVNRLENHISTLARNLYKRGGGDPHFVMIGGILTTAEGYNNAGSNFELPTHETASCPMPDDCALTGPESPQAEDQDLPKGPGDLASINITTDELMVVEQTLRRYELGEVAHIENVLLGERKDRTHRRKENKEEFTFIETENIEDTERDLQSTDRFELQAESSKVINSDTSLGVGLTVSGKYGPTVEFSANTSFSRDTSREESNSTATSFSRDVTERAVSRVQQRVLERRTKREMLEVEETNFHQLNNVLGNDHIAGIYRWVDKIYRAQVINYGLRMQLEIMIPEPAAFMKYAMAGHKSAGIDLLKPQEPGYCKPGTSSFVPLSPQDICASNYMFWVTRYDATGVKPPPPAMKIVGKAFDNKNVHKGIDTVSDSEIRVPDGYRAERAWIIDGGVTSGTKPEITALVGRHYLTDTPEHHTKPLNGEDGDLPVSLMAFDIRAYQVNIEVECRLGQEKYQAWQLETYEAIMIAFNDKIAEYDGRLAALQIQQGVVISGNNPLRNEKLIRDELKRSAISIISGQHFDSFSALRKGVGEEGYPQVDLSRVALEGPYIRFFEQAFEWEHVAYLFYPYFWGRKDDWIKNILLDDNDPMFADFLRAGAARLLVPVRPGFEEAVAGFLVNGWLMVDGEDLALPAGEGLEDDSAVLPLLSMLAEVKARQGYDGTEGEGLVDVTNGSANVSGVGTNFTSVFDTQREIHILGTKYLIAAVTSETAVILDRPYEGNSQAGLHYSLGVQLIGEPWQVRVPTSLVFLENSVSSLPVFGQTPGP